ncbi:MAG: CHAP domain-containing protein [bacterium]|nr:CHAP domain-containing protein [bacterium]
MQENLISIFKSRRNKGVNAVIESYQNMGNLSDSYKRASTSARKRIVRNGIIFSNVAVLALVSLFVFGSKQQTSPTSNSVNSSDSAQVNPLDELSSADIAVHAAQMARLDEVKAVVNNADSVNAQLSIVPTDSQVVAKPQIVSTGLKSKRDIVVYTTVEGDSVSAIAKKFGVTTESVKWSNDLGADAIAAGRTLRIPPVNGIVYQVKPNDTADTLASKYQASKDQIIAFNDAEISGLVRDDFIVIPGGKIPTPVARSIPASNNFSYGSLTPRYGGNGYDFGYCTWWAAKRRAEIGRPVPNNLGNASTWKVLAQRAGLGVGSTPQAGAVIWTPPRDYYGHVAFVEEVFEDGRVRVSEMNVRGWNVRSEKILTPAQAAGYGYIY